MYIINTEHLSRDTSDRNTAWVTLNGRMGEDWMPYILWMLVIREHLN